MAARLSNRTPAAKAATSLVVLFAAASAAMSARAAEEAVLSYRRLDLVSPKAGETFNNIGGHLRVVARVDPPLAPDDIISIYFDGKRVADLPPGTTEYELQDVWRGTHHLSLEISGHGQTLIRSAPVEFYVHQHSILLPRKK